MGSWGRLPAIFHFLEVIMQVCKESPDFGALLSCCKRKLISCIVKVLSTKYFILYGA